MLANTDPTPSISIHAVVHKNLAVKCGSKKTISSRRFELKLTTIHCKCSQTHRVSLPSSSQNLATKFASQKEKRIHDRLPGSFPMFPSFANPSPAR